MNLKGFMVICLFCSSTLGWTAPHYFYLPSMRSRMVQADHVQRSFCEIEIINDNHTDLLVYGILDNGTSLKPFKMYANEYVQYIDLYDYNNYCHAGMNLYILTFKGNSVYSAYTQSNSTIHLVPVLARE